MSGDASLYQLHRILQIVMGWEDYHLYQFEVCGLLYGDPHPDYENFEIQMRDARRIRVRQTMTREEARAVYTYDFGDGWRHELVIEKILPARSGIAYPVCLDGERACPPEDCGGIGGYAHLLKVINDPAHPEYEEMRVWLGQQFDPESFDMVRINKRLRTMPGTSAGRPRAKPRA